jgi:hypothetical protein
MEVYPNPTEGQISIEFKVAVETEASLGVYDVNGTLKVDILNEKLPEGQYRYSAELGNLTPGIYDDMLPHIEENYELSKPYWQKTVYQRVEELVAERFFDMDQYNNFLITQILD